MRILLVYPKTTVLYKAFSIDIPPLGLLYVAGNLRQHGHIVSILDENVNGPVEQNDMAQYDVIGLGPSTCCYNRALTIAARAKEMKKFVMMGGFHATFMDEETLRTGFVDAVVRGEGEVTSAALADTLAGGEDIGTVLGVSYLNGNTLVRTPDRPVLEDLDSIPYPARDLIDISKYRLFLEGKPVTPFSTSRGCSHDCHFCAATKFNARRWRARRPELVVDEMEYALNKRQGEGFIITDDNFTVNPKRVREICGLIRSRGLHIPWWCMSRTDVLVNNRDIVKNMADAGCKTVFLGIESGKEDVLSDMNKRATTAMAREAVDILNDAGIGAYGSFIMGDIRETAADIKKTIAFSKSLKLEVAQFSIITPFPGTELYKNVKDRISDTNWDHYEGLHSVIRLDTLSKKKVENLLLKAYLGFYLRPRILWLIFKNIIVRNRSLKVIWTLSSAFLKRIFKDTAPVTAK